MITLPGPLARPEGDHMLNALEIYEILLAAYGRPRWWSDDAFTVMFQSVLVQNTTFSGVEKTCAAIGKRLTPQYMERLSTQELEELITPCGFYRAKARTIQALIAWFRRYRFDPRGAQDVPTHDLRKELLAIRGIGAETADVILVYAFYRPSFVIDAYTRRFLSRLGHSFSDDTAIREFMVSVLPRDARLYGWYHWLILDHCISCCRKSPVCGACPLREYCERPAAERETASPGRQEKICYNTENIPPRRRTAFAADSGEIPPLHLP